MINYPYDILTVDLPSEAYKAAKEIARETPINRHKASNTVSSDVEIGVLGEMAWAELRYGFWGPGWLKVKELGPKGTIDDGEVEIKCSNIMLSPNLHLLAKEEYVKRRSPEFYVQFIMDGEKIYFVGWATHDEVKAASTKDFGTKFGRGAGYKCHAIKITQLHKPWKLLRALVA